MPGIEISVEGLLGNLTPENAAALSGGPLDGGQVWYEFLTQEDDRVRPSHRALHGTVWTAGDPAAPMPPLDYGCRCFIRYVAAPGSDAAKILPPAPSKPTTQDAAFGTFLDAEAAGWRAAMAKANQGPAGDVLPDMATYFIGTGMSSSQAKDAARMAAAATQATRAIPATIALPPAATPLEPEKPAVATLPPASVAETVALEPLLPVLQRPAPARATVAPTADQAADQAAADAKAQAAWEAAQAAKQAAASAAANAAYLADQAAQAAAAEAKAKAARAAAVAADKAKVAAAAQAKAAAAAAEDAAAEQAYQAKLGAAKAKQVAELDAMLAQQASAKQAAMEATMAKMDALAGGIGKPKKVLSPEQKAINNLKSKERRARKKAELQAAVDSPSKVGTVAPATDAERMAAKVVYPDFQPAATPRSSAKLTASAPFGSGADRLAAMRAATSMSDVRAMAPRVSSYDISEKRDAENTAAKNNLQVSGMMHTADASTAKPVVMFTHGHDRYMRAIDGGKTEEYVIADLIRGAKTGKGPIRHVSDASDDELRQAAKAKYDEMKAAVDKLNEALSKEAFARRVPVVFRGMHSLTDAQMRAIINGDNFKFGAMSSTSTRYSVGESFATHGGGNQPVFRMRNARGIAIKAKSVYSGEDEVLIAGDEEFRIVSVSRLTNSGTSDGWLVDMEAIQ